MESESHESPKLNSNWVSQIKIDTEAMNELHDRECRSYTGNIVCPNLYRLPMMPDKFWCKKYEKILEGYPNPSRIRVCDQLKFLNVEEKLDFIYEEI